MLGGIEALQMLGDTTTTLAIKMKIDSTPRITFQWGFSYLFWVSFLAVRLTIVRERKRKKEG
jgi:hypothetical protein